MPYGQYSGPDKADKGKKHGSCNRSSCQDNPAIWWNHGSYAWYCERCKNDIYDAWAQRMWIRDFPKADYPMFETVEMMAERKKETT